MKSKVLIGMVLFVVVALSTTTGCGMWVSQQDYNQVKSEYDKLKADYDQASTDLNTLSETFSLQADSMELTNNAEIKWMRVLKAVLKFEQRWYYEGETLAEAAYERLDAFIIDAEELVAIEEKLSNQVPAEYYNVYELSARRNQAKLKEAESLKEELQGRVLYSIVNSEYNEAYRNFRTTNEPITEQQKKAWLSSLDEAILHYQPAITLLNEAIDIAPELTGYFDEKIEDTENYQRQVSSMKARIEQPPVPAPKPVPVPPPAPAPS